MYGGAAFFLEPTNLVEIGVNSGVAQNSGGSATLI